MFSVGCGNSVQLAGPDKKKITGLQRKGFSIYFIDNAVILCKHNFNIVMPVQTEIGGDMRNRDIVNIAVSKMIVFEKEVESFFMAKESSVSDKRYYTTEERKI